MKHFALKPTLAFLPFVLLLLSFLACKKSESAIKADDQRELINLYNEIKAMSEQVACNDVTEWKFVAIGDQGCSGPESYMPYSTKIDTVKFLQKVEAYNQKQKAFNKKWNILIDCALLAKPMKVQCKDGKPTMIYYN